ncbi:hypothetical protein MNEG_14703, partial [Monoraphidium neglectum]
ATSAAALRDGQLQQVAAADLVPGDVIEVAGERRPSHPHARYPVAEAAGGGCRG